MKKSVWLAVVLITVTVTVGFADWQDGLLILSPSIKLGFAITMGAEGIADILSGVETQEPLGSLAFLFCYAIPNAFLLWDMMNDKPENVRFWRELNFGIDIAFLCTIGLGFPLSYFEPWKSRINAIPINDLAIMYSFAMLLIFSMAFVDSIPFSMESGRKNDRNLKSIGFFEHISFTIVNDRESNTPYQTIKPYPRIGICFRF